MSNLNDETKDIGGYSKGNKKVKRYGEYDSECLAIDQQEESFDEMGMNMFGVQMKDDIRLNAPGLRPKSNHLPSLKKEENVYSKKAQLTGSSSPTSDIRKGTIPEMQFDENLK